MRNYLLIILTMFFLGLPMLLGGCNPSNTTAPIRSIDNTYQTYGGAPDEWVRYQVHNPDN